MSDGDGGGGGEFDLIAAHLAPLTEGHPDALDLTDDVAWAPQVPAGRRLMVSHDMLVAGVHFFPDDPLDAVAQKALRVNLSDIAAKGGTPMAYMLGCAWPPGVDADAVAEFARGLAADQALYGLRLLGGDTTRTEGPLTVGVTIFGHGAEEGLVSRGGAQPGDGVFVTGVLGDAYLGLMARRGALQGALQDASPAEEWLARYLRPEPRVAAGPLLAAHASAAADVSDGLIADLGHIAKRSGVAVHLDVESIPVSPPSRAWIDAQADPVAAAIELASGGDDYEIAFTAPADAQDALEKIARESGTPIRQIGRVALGPGHVVIRDAAGKVRQADRKGHDHFRT